MHVPRFNIRILVHYIVNVYKLTLIALLITIINNTSYVTRRINLIIITSFVEIDHLIVNVFSSSLASCLYFEK